MTGRKPIVVVGDAWPATSREGEGPGAVTDLSGEAARAVTEEVRQATVRLLDSLADVDEAVARAYDGRAWLALGYANWESYCAAEFSQARLWGTVDERRERVSALRTAGLSTRAIAAVLGVSKATPGRDIAVLSGATSVAPDALGGGEATPSTLSPATPGVAGVDGKQYRPLRAMPEQLLERKLSVAELHSDGLRQEEIAERLGVSQATVSADLAEMRRMAEAAPEPIREALSNPTLTRAETMSRLQDLVLPRVQLGPIATRVIADVAASMRTLHRDIYMDDAWQDETQRRAAATAIIAGGLGEVLLLAAELAEHITGDDVEVEEERWMRFTQAIGDSARALARAARDAHDR